jgi:hypothetical protein
MHRSQQQRQRCRGLFVCLRPVVGPFGPARRCPIGSAISAVRSGAARGGRLLQFAALRARFNVLLGFPRVGGHSSGIRAWQSIEHAGFAASKVWPVFPVDRHLLQWLLEILLAIGTKGSSRYTRSADSWLRMDFSASAIVPFVVGFFASGLSRNTHRLFQTATSSGCHRSRRLAASRSRPRSSVASSCRYGPAARRLPAVDFCSRVHYPSPGLCIARGVTDARSACPASDIPYGSLRSVSLRTSVQQELIRPSPVPAHCEVKDVQRSGRVRVAVAAGL